jgi:hypothetical protein
MTKYKITFPQWCNDSIYTYEDVLTEYNLLAAKDKIEVVFDCSNVNFITPLGLNILSCFLYSMLEKKNTVFLKKPQKKIVDKYLTDQGFYCEFMIQEDSSLTSQPRNTSIGLKRMYNPIEYSYFEEVEAWLNRNIDCSEKMMKEIVNPNVVEVVQNVSDHSQSRIGCYISAQAYHKNDILIFVIMDLGIGFLKSLSPRFSNIKSNSEAIKKAVQEGVSSKSRPNNMGAGLSIICGYLIERGSVEIISYDGYWKQKQNGEESSEQLDFSLPGSCVILSFDKGSIKKRFEQEKLDEDQDFFF